FTIGPRIGVASGKWLVYGTGGYAAGLVNTHVTVGGAPFDNTTQHQDGWFAGGGVEYALLPYLIFGVEYQHLDLGTANHPSPLDVALPGNGCLSSAAGGPNCRAIGASEDIVRARLSFKFSGLGLARTEPMK